MPVERGDALFALGLTFAAGLATTIGAVVPFFAPLQSKKILSIALGLSAGVMTYVSFIEIFYKSKTSFAEFNGETHATLSAMGCFFGGIIFASILEWLVHLIDPEHDHQIVEKSSSTPSSESDVENIKNQSTPSSNLEGDHLEITTGNEYGSIENNTIISNQEMNVSEPAPQEHVSFFDKPIEWIKRDWRGTNEAQKGENKRLQRTGIFSGLAIAIHNFPEGLATFVGAVVDPKIGISLAVAIAIHNIPEGICVSMPIYYATGSKIRAFLWAFLSGISEPIGGLLGWLIISLANDSPLIYAIMFGLVGGMMVYISIKELVPTAHKYDANDKFASWSFVLGMLIMSISLVLFEY